MPSHAPSRRSNLQILFPLLKLVLRDIPLGIASLQDVERGFARQALIRLRSRLPNDEVYHNSNQDDDQKHPHKHSSVSEISEIHHRSPALPAAETITAACG